MKKFMMILTAGLVSLAAEGTLINIGEATYNGNTYGLIWDDDSAGSSKVWLDYSHATATRTDVLATAVHINNSLSLNVNSGYSVTWSGSWMLSSTDEMNDLYYNEFGFSYGQYVSASALNASEFDNLTADWYWLNDTTTQGYYLNYGGVFPRTQNSKGLFIRTADVQVVPEPATAMSLLIGGGLLGLIRRFYGWA